MELRTRLRIAALAAGLVALLAIVALAARAGRGGLPGGGAIGGPSVGFYDFAFTFVLVLGGAIAILVFVSTVQLRTWRPRELGRWYVIRSLLPILLIAAIATLVVLAMFGGVWGLHKTVGLGGFFR